MSIFKHCPEGLLPPRMERGKDTGRSRRVLLSIYAVHYRENSL